MSKTGSLDIRSGLLFPFPFLMLGSGFILAGVGIIASHPLLSLLLVPVGLLIVTAFEGTEINVHERSYREYVSYFYLKRGTTKKFNNIEKIYINAGNVSQRMYTAHTTSSSIFTNTEYRVYIKFDGGEKVFLFSGKNRNDILRRSKKIAQSLNTSLQDNTVGMPA